MLYEYQARHGVKMINGRPRHSQSQGSVERGNKYLKPVICINHVVLKEWISAKKHFEKKNNNDKENDFTEEFFLHLSIFKNYLNQLVNLVAINWYVQLV